MRYPLRKTILAAGLAIASFTLAAKAGSPELTSHSASFEEPTPESKTSLPVPAPAPSPSSNDNEVSIESAKLYTEMELDKAGMNSEAFDIALSGFEKLTKEGKIKKTNLITIIDFSQPSTKKRLYVIDLEEREILFQSVVSHGRNTGSLWAKSFSNQSGSYKSSPGFYITAETYMGGNGYSLRLDGLERNINNNARARAIVMHGAPYANESSIRSLGFLGRSQGCPALPQTLTRPVINTIKDGTCLFIYTPEKGYLQLSEFV